MNAKKMPDIWYHIALGTLTSVIIAIDSNTAVLIEKYEYIAVHFASDEFN